MAIVVLQLPDHHRGLSPLSSQVVRAVHVGFVLLMMFVAVPAARQRSAGSGWAVGGVGFVFSLYHWVFEADLTQRAGELTDCGLGRLAWSRWCWCLRPRGASWAGRCP